jgi:hypothetical protein
MTICVPVSNGEVMDKFSILLIKKEFIKDNSKLDKVNTEIEFLIEHINNIKQQFNIDLLFSKLLDVNKQLWTIEDNIRQKEKNKEFDEEFIEIARSVYFTNDKRCEIKNEINILTNSSIYEVKSYEKYD